MEEALAISGVGQQGLCLFGIERQFGHLGCASDVFGCELVGDGGVAGKQSLRDRVAVDGHRQGLTHRDLGQRTGAIGCSDASGAFRIGVEHDEDGLQPRHGGEGELVVPFHQGQVFRARFFHDVEIARQKAGDARAVVRHRADHDAIPFGRRAPIGFVPDQIGVAGGLEMLVDIGSSADRGTAVIEVRLGGIEVDDAAIALTVVGDVSLDAGGRSRQDFQEFQLLRDDRIGAVVSNRTEWSPVATTSVTGPSAEVTTLALPSTRCIMRHIE